MGFLPSIVKMFEEVAVMVLAVVGGRLQGVEACYLAADAGWKTFVIDKDKNAPAAGICDTFVHGDATDGALLDRVFKEADFVLPAIENDLVLGAVSGAAARCGVPLLFDKRAYELSSSKLASDSFFARCGIPAPTPWPDCGLPVIAKPSSASGSDGVSLLTTREEYDAFAARNSGPTVFQQYLDGPSYSVEVIGNGRDYEALQVTELFMDEVYDCRRVVAPSGLTPGQIARFSEISLKIGRELGIRGIFDVECILHDGEFKILEIDARLPSQTPTAVLRSSGVNIFAELWRVCAAGGQPGINVREDGAVLYEHVSVGGGEVRLCGEHIMCSAGHLRRERDFFGAGEALTNFREGCASFVATMIHTAKTRGEVLAAQERSMVLLLEYARR